MIEELNVIGIAGSLRKGSYNKSLLRAAKKLAPKNMKIEIFDLEGIPLFNQDHENDPPAIVKDLKAKIRAADAVLFALPEYNYSFPGVLKNAIDYASRPYGDNAWEGKPVAIMSASIGMLGGARAQYHIRQTFVFLKMLPINTPEVMVPFAAERFDSEGNLTDEVAKKFIVDQLNALAEWTLQLKSR